jgi:hypothetical protein
MMPIWVVHKILASVHILEMSQQLIPSLKSGIISYAGFSACEQLFVRSKGESHLRGIFRQHLQDIHKYKT